MSTPVVTDRDAYADRVRAALADLPPADQADLLAELDDHLAEVASEIPEGGPLAERLGPPEAYAAELRAAAGLPPGPAGEPAGRGPLGGLAGRVPPAVRDLLVELRPGWWLLRGVLAAWLVAALLGSVAGGVLAGLVLVPASVALGRWEVADRRVRLAALAATVLVAVTLLAGLLTGLRGYDYIGVPVSDPVPDLPGVTNVHPYSSDGKPLTDVLLYDQNGNPIRLDGGTDAAGNPITVVPRYTRDGEVVPNLYPQEQTVEDYTVTLDGAEVTSTRRRVPAPTVTPPALQPR